MYGRVPITEPTTLSPAMPAIGLLTSVSWSDGAWVAVTRPKSATWAMP
jgi:hypothetical protein